MQISSYPDRKDRDSTGPGPDQPEIPVTAEALVAAARLLLVPRPRLKMISLGQPLEVPDMVPLGAADGGSALATLKRICGPAAVCLRQAIALDPTHAGAHSLLADVYEELGCLEAAIQCRRRALELEPGNENEQRSLARSLLLDEQPENAERCMTALLPKASKGGYRTLACLDFEEWASEQDAPVRGLIPPSSICYQFQAYFDGNMTPVSLDIRPQGLSVAEVQDLTLFCGRVPVAQNGSFIAGTMENGAGVPLPCVQIAGGNAIIVDSFGADETIDGPCLVLCGAPMHYKNYFHAVAQNFIRLPLILRDPAFAGLPLAVSETIRSWAEDFLAALGVSHDRLIYVKIDRSTLFRRALVPSPPTRLRAPSVEEAEALRAVLYAGGPAAARQDRLFVTRDALPKLKRLLINEQELQEIAVEHGFTPIDPGRMTILEQVKAFSQAAAVCGATGSGLTNLLYAPENATAICFSPRETCRSVFVGLSAVTRQRFNWCLGPFLPEALASSQFPQLPYSVNEEDFRGLLGALEDQGI